MARIIQNAGCYNYTNSGDSAISEGTVVINGTLFGIADKAIPVGGLGTIAIDGVWELPKGSGAITLGAALYWDASNSVVTTSASTNLFCGHAVAAALTGDSVVSVAINTPFLKAAGTASGT